MRKIIYIGNSLDAAAMLYKIDSLLLIGILCDKKRASEELNAFANKNKIDYKIVANSHETNEALNTWDFHFAIMYSFGLIISKEAIYNHNIYNFHPGDLRSNRGSTPINWSIVLGDTVTKMVLYHLTDFGIDLGEIVSEKSVEIIDEDNVATLRKKLEGLIPVMVDELLKFIDNEEKGNIIFNGIYRPRIAEKDYTIDREKDSERIIQRKIKSQETYEGAILLTENGVIRIKTWDDYVKAIDKIK